MEEPYNWKTRFKVYEELPPEDAWPPPGTDEPQEEPIKRRADEDWIEEEINRDRRLYCAEAALAHYNKKKRKNYKLVKAINSRGFLDEGMWYHCVFKAAADDQQDGDTDHMMFFTEIEDRGTDNLIITSCRFIDGAKTKTTYDGCTFCQGMNIPHPINGYSRGNPIFDPPTLRSRGRKTVPPA